MTTTELPRDDPSDAAVIGRRWRLRWVLLTGVVVAVVTVAYVVIARRDESAHSLFPYYGDRFRRR
jgi:hypothetical protein